MQRELILLRHAKSAWPLGVHDDLRPLNERGRSNAEAVSADLQELMPIDQVLVSPAKRTQQTAELALSTPELAKVPVVVAPGLYDALLWDVLDVVHELDPAFHRVLIIGHNPGLGDLALALAGEGSDPVARAELRTKFPTASLAVLTGAQDWSDWQANSAALRQFSTPASRNHS